MITDRNLAAFAEMHLSQGDQVYIEGQQHTEYRQDKAHQWRSLTTIFLSHDDDQLRFFIPGEDFADVNSPNIPTQIAAQNARRIKTSSDQTGFDTAA